MMAVNVDLGGEPEAAVMKVVVGGQSSTQDLVDSKNLLQTRIVACERIRLSIPTQARAGKSQLSGTGMVPGWPHVRTGRRTCVYVCYEVKLMGIVEEWNMEKGRGKEG